MVPQNCSVSHILVVQGVCLCVCVCIYIYIQGRPLGGATGAVAPGPAPRDERNPPPPPNLPPSVTRSQKDRGGPHSIPRTGPRVSQGRPCIYIYIKYAQTQWLG